MRIVYGDDFIKQAKKLPTTAKKFLSRGLVFLKNNPYDSRLHAKRLSGDLTGFLSFRITRDYRVIFYFLDEETIKLVDVAHRKDIYR